MNMLWADLGAKAGNPTALDQQLTQLCSGDTSSLELVSKRHESMAFLISLSHLQTTLENNGYTLDEDELLGVLNAGDPCKALKAVLPDDADKAQVLLSPLQARMNKLQEAMEKEAAKAKQPEDPYADMPRASNGEIILRGPGD